MLWFVGTGLGGCGGIGLQALETLNQCDIVYVERFTSALTDSEIDKLRSLIGDKVIPVQRWFVEDGREILENARSKKVALVTYGDPLIATTHNELRCRAARSSVQTSVSHSASGIYSSIGEAGLQAYKFGRTVTMMSDPHSATSVYSTIHENLVAGNHTLVITEYSHDVGKEPFFLDPLAVFQMLLDAESIEKAGVFTPESFVVVASRVGDANQKIISGKVASLLRQDFGKGPHSIIIPGSIHFVESECITSLSVNLDPPTDNSKTITRISKRMIENYAPKARLAIQNMREIIRSEQDGANNKGLHEVLDNAEYYVSDAEHFLNQGKAELAVLSIGYAEGLVDALRFQKGINPWTPPS